jgi:unsaturated chondroitin disaccharide hydrolase
VVVTEWAVRALGRVLERVESTLSTVGDRFPLYADPVTSAWRTTRRGSWAGGCWVGLLWLRARLTGSARHCRQAEEWARRLEPWVDADTAVRGLIFWYGAAAGGRLGVSEVGQVTGLRGARALCASFRDDAGVLPWGTAFGDEDEVRARVDAVAGAVPLLAWSATWAPGQRDGAARVAANHCRQHLRLCLTGEQLTPAWIWRGRAGGWTAAAEPPRNWSRGLAWLMLATADASAWLGPEFAPPAHDLAHRWLRRQADQRIPHAVGGRACGPLDTSAAAIAALALLKLGYDREGGGLLRALVDGHLTDGHDGRPAGMLLDGCYEPVRGVATEHELVWGDFFLAVGLATVAGMVARDAL